MAVQKRSKNLNLDEIKNIELNILLYIDNVCRENNLKYYLCGGTLLGAIRHKGFIPWDDDIDIFMPRNDYEKLITILGNRNNKYLALNYRTVENFYLPFTKIVDVNTFLQEEGVPQVKELGVFIDLFPLDGISKNFFIKECQLLGIKILKKLLACKVNTGNIRNYSKARIILRRIIKFLLIPVSIKNINRMIDLMSQLYKYSKNELCISFCGAYGRKEVFDKNKLFSSVIELEFENYLFYAPGGVDYYLTQIYGDYMKLPPIKERKSNHIIKEYFTK